MEPLCEEQSHNVGETIYEDGARGESFGWSAIIEPYLNVLSALCLGESNVIAIDGMRLRHLLESQESIGCHVLHRLVNLLYHRLQQTRSALLSQV
jgi:hypothetical protein